jgi:ATP-dependent Clp protease protease subunit
MEWTLPKFQEEEEEEEEKEELEKESKLTAGVAMQLMKLRTIMLAGEINKALADRITSQLLVLDGQASDEPIRIFINSPGGDADAGFAMYDMIKFIKSPVVTISAGLCASAAVLVLMGAPKERRFALPNSRILIHQPSTAIHGFVADIQIEASEIVKCRDRINKIIADETGQTIDKVMEDTRRNYWMSAEESKAYGLVCNVVQSRDEVQF